MMVETITIAVRPDRTTFVRFALFDTFVQKRRWARSALFSAILLAFAIVGAFVPNRAEAPPLTAVLASVGIGLPAAYFFMYLASVRKKAKALKLDGRRTVYTLRLTDAPDGIRVAGTDETASYQWSGAYGAWRARGCVYLYVTKERAFLLPDGQATAGAAALWAFLAARLPDGRAHGRVR